MNRAQLKSFVSIASVSGGAWRCATVRAAGVLAICLWFVAQAGAQMSWSWVVLDPPPVPLVDSWGVAIVSSQVPGFQSIAGDYGSWDADGRYHEHGFFRNVSGDNNNLFDVPGSVETHILGMSNTNGHLAGSYQDQNGTYHAFRTDTFLLSISTYGNVQSEAFAINDSGVAVGYYWDGSTDVPFYWNNGFIYRIYYSGSYWGRAMSIDPNGNIAGVMSTLNGPYPSGGFFGFYRDTQGTVSTFGISGATDMRVTGIGNGQIAGDYADAIGIRHGFLASRYVSRGGSTYWRASAFDVSGSGGTWVSGINSTGTMAGYYTDSRGHTQGYVRNPQGTITVAAFPGASDTVVEAINDQAALTGRVTLPGFGDHPFEATPQ
jgi:hypothetical protein